MSLWLGINIKLAMRKVKSFFYTSGMILVQESEFDILQENGDNILTE